MEQKIKKIAVIILSSFFLLTSVLGQQMELNDPQIISIVEATNQITTNYGKVALERTKDSRVRKFARAMVDEHTRLFDQTLALEKELILSTQTNVLTRSLVKRESETMNLLKHKKKKYFDVIYVDNEVSFHEEAVSTLRNILIPQARNAKLKDFLTKVLPLWERSFEASKKIQIEINR